MASGYHPATINWYLKNKNLGLKASMIHMAGIMTIILLLNPVYTYAICYTEQSSGWRCGHSFEAQLKLF